MTNSETTVPDPLHALLTEKPDVIAAGPSLFDEALAAQNVPVQATAWRPPLGPAEEVARVMGDPRRPTANAEALQRMLTARPHLVDIRPAGEALALDHGTFLHAGPPLEWNRATGPVRGALIGAAVYEGLAADAEQAERMLATAPLEPCHRRGAVGSMAGVISPSTWVYVVEDFEHGGRAYSPLLEGQGEVLNFGAYGPRVIERLNWMDRVLGPTLHDAVQTHGPVDLNALRGQALQMGDELHNRTRAATSLLFRTLASPLAAAPAAHEVLEFINDNDLFFLTPSMAAGKACADAARGVPGSSLVVAMARNGTDFGVQVSGTGDTWHVGPAAVPDGLYLGGYGVDDANPDIGDSAITETTGLGGFALAAAPAIVRFVGGEASHAATTTHKMYEITLGEHPAFRIPALDFRGTPAGIDVMAVVRSGIRPVITTGIAGRVAGTGQIGAGVTSPPIEAFTRALHDLAEFAEEA